MDLEYSATEKLFRDDIRAFIGQNLSRDVAAKVLGHKRLSREDIIGWHRVLHTRGWSAPTWPREFGGPGWTAVQQHIFDEECTAAGAPPVIAFGVRMVAPVIMKYGSAAQQQFFLPRILSGEHWWCQGYTEPGAGSDLASLKTKAVRSGDGWVVTGQKVWTTMAHQSKWCMLLARTDPNAAKHRGLTYFLMDMEQDGVETRPLRQITGEAEFNELFMEEARIPDENIVGGEGNGWPVAITTLMHERAGLAFALQARVQVALGELADELKGTTDPVIRQRFAQIAIEAQVLRLLAYRGLTSAMKSGEPGPEGSLGKWLWADINQSLTTLAMDVKGPSAQLVDDKWTYRFLRARANSIEGGTTEILKNIVAERVLGLPRG